MPKYGPPKYEPVRAYLASRPPRVVGVTLTLPEIEAIVGAPLPRTAHTRGFWANTSGVYDRQPQVRAWLSAGWRVAGFDRAAGAVTFARKSPAGP